MTLSVEMKEMLEELGKEIIPMVDAAVKTAVAAASPVAAVVADPVIDAVDAYVLSLLGTPLTEEAAAKVPPVTLDTIAKHVAALTVATGNASSTIMGVSKAATVPLAASNAPQA